MRYAKLKLRPYDSSIIELTTANKLIGLLEGESDEYKYIGSIDIDYLNSVLEEAKPSVIYIDPITLSKLNVAFYKKYRNVIEEVLYTPDGIY